MIDDRRDARRTLYRIFVGALLVAALVLFALWRTENPRLDAVRLAALDAAAPVLEAVAGPSEALTGLFGGVRSYSDLRAENARLREELDRLRAWRDVAEALEQENARLRALNAVELPPRVSFVTAEVIADAGGPFARSVVVNVGREDGVEDGAPALDAGGLVGRVAGVGERSARILLLTDPSSRAPVRVGARGVRAILSGDDTASPALQYLQDPGAVLDDARIATSGDGGVFPSGLTVGRLVASEDGVFRAALAGDVSGLEFVRILRRADAVEAAPGASVVAPPAADPAAVADPASDADPESDDAPESGGGDAG